MVNRRIGKESSETRQLLLSAAEQLMREEGYAEVTSRKLARRAGLKPQLVHYYFRTMDELFEALFRRVTEKYLAAMKEIAEQDDALVRMFELSCYTSSAALHLEFLALANHRKAIHSLIAEFAVELNRIEADIIRQAMKRHGIETPGVTPEELSTIIETVARGLAFASRINTDRFTNARRVLTDWLDQFGITYRTLSDISAKTFPSTTDEANGRS
jgi:TetR/AcrR family transcriptional regulator